MGYDNSILGAEDCLDYKCSMNKYISCRRLLNSANDSSIINER